MDKKLPARPNIEHLRSQAKTLLSQMKRQDGAARLADAQLAIARQSGFASWPALSRHVQHLRSLEGEWRFAALEIDGNAMPAAAFAESRLLIDGDRFRTESPEGRYEGVFTVDADQVPRHIDIEFVEGPEAGNWCYGLCEVDGDRLTLCLGLAGAPRPKGFTTAPGSGHALERLRRVSAARPADVSGGVPHPSAPAAGPATVDPASFDAPPTSLLQRLEGDWVPVELSMNGTPMPVAFLSYGSRTARGNEVKVVFGGQTMVHAKVRIDESATPIAVDYLNLQGKYKNTVSCGIMEWIGDDVRFLMAGPGESRPAGFADAATTGTLSRWRRRP